MVGDRQRPADAFRAVQCRVHKGPGDGYELPSAAVECGRKFIIACGGDGTINEVANGILETGEDVELGVLPSGTGGDFRRTIEMPHRHTRSRTSLRRPAKQGRSTSARSHFRIIDGETVSRYFLNVSSFGLAASIIERVKSDTSLAWLPIDAVRGRASFALSTLQQVIGLDLDNSASTASTAAKNSSLHTINFCVANARYFGGGMKIAPDAKLSDGFLDVVNIGDIRTAKIIAQRPHALPRHAPRTAARSKTRSPNASRPCRSNDATRSTSKSTANCPARCPPFTRSFLTALKSSRAGWHADPVPEYISLAFQRASFYKLTKINCRSCFDRQRGGTKVSQIDRDTGRI